MNVQTLNSNVIMVEICHVNYHWNWVKKSVHRKLPNVLMPLINLDLYPEMINSPFTWRPVKEPADSITKILWPNNYITVIMDANQDKNQ